MQMYFRSQSPAGQVLLDHQATLKVMASSNSRRSSPVSFLIFSTVHQGIPVDEQLPGRLGHVQIVLKELVDGKQGLLVQGVDGILLEYLLQNISQSVVGS